MYLSPFLACAVAINVGGLGCGGRPYLLREVVLTVLVQSTAVSSSGSVNLLPSTSSNLSGVLVIVECAINWHRLVHTVFCEISI